MNRPRLVMFTKDVPWPRTNGYRLRLASQVQGLAQVGDLDLIALSRDERAATADKPDSIRLHDYRVIPYPTRDRRHRRLVRWLVSGRPRRLAGGEWPRATPEILEHLDPLPDLIWWSHTDAWVALADSVEGSSILDFDNIESARIAHRRSRRPPPTGGGRRATVVTRLGRLVSNGFDAVDERRWRRLERKAVAETDATVVCSRLDLDRTSRASTHVIPNGYEPPFERTTAREIDPDHPTLLFVGLLTYEPNIDGVEWFVGEVLPLVKRRYPRCSLHLVGRIGQPLARRIGDHAGVTVLGEVPDLGPELEAADVTIVPLRIGGGTRLKIIEAFATGIPVVSTSVGAEGLGVTAGRQLLIGDTAEEFAAACCELIAGHSRREALVRSGHAHFDQHFRWSAVCDQITDLATAVLEGADVPG